MNGLNAILDIAQEVEKRGYCKENLRLRNDFLQAICDVTDLQAEQIKAVIDDDSDFTRFDLLLHQAHEKKDQSKYAWITHVETHRCEEI